MNKYYYLTLIASIIFIVALGCEKSECQKKVAKSDLFGTWINVNDNRDTLFIMSDSIKRIDTITMKPLHVYAYSLKDDSIVLKYNGHYYIEVLMSSFGIRIKENGELSIENFNNYYPYYSGIKFKKTKK